MERKCSKCGSKLTENEAYCSQCGTKYEEEIKKQPSKSTDENSDNSVKSDNEQKDKDKPKKKSLVQKMKDKPIKSFFIILGILVLIGAANSGDNNSNKSSNTNSQETTAEVSTNKEKKLTAEEKKQVKKLTEDLQGYIKFADSNPDNIVFTDSSWNEYQEKIGEARKLVDEKSNDIPLLEATLSQVKDAAEGRELDTSKFTQMPYSSVARNPEDYSGKPMRISGKVLQASGSTLRVATSGSYDNVVLVSTSAAEKDGNILEDDHITIYGLCTGTTTYKTVLGAEKTLPSISALKVVID